METTKQNDTTERDLLFAFAHGINMTFASLGLDAESGDITHLLIQMDQILKSPRNSLVKGTDQLNDWEQFRRFRQIESSVCTGYLQEYKKWAGTQDDEQ